MQSQSHTYFLICFLHFWFSFHFYHSLRHCVFFFFLSFRTVRNSENQTLIFAETKHHLKLMMSEGKRPKIKGKREKKKKSAKFSTGEQLNTTDDNERKKGKSERIKRQMHWKTLQWHHYCVYSNDIYTIHTYSMFRMGPNKKNNNICQETNQTHSRN